MIRLSRPNIKYKDSFICSFKEIGCIEDVEVFNRYMSVNEASAFFDFKSFVDGINSLAKEHHFWIIVDDEYAGRVVLFDIDEEKTMVRLSYQVISKMRGKGVASIAMALAKDNAKLLGYKKIIIHCMADNIPSQKVILKNGGTIEGKFSDNGIEKIQYEMDV